jgi:hypothetical protein
MIRARLYRIATNVCLDLLRRHTRRPTRAHSFADVPWLQPYPDELVDQVSAAVAICARDISVTMPPHPYVFDGRDAIAPLMAEAIGPNRIGDWRLVATRANRMQTAASYLRRPGDSEFRAFKLDVLRIEAGLIAEITTFGPELFPEFGLAAIR